MKPLLLLALACAPAVAAERDGPVGRLLDRPLFTAGRRQAPPRAPDAVPAAAAPRLMGIVVSGDLRQAIFAAPPGRPALIVREGDPVGAYTVGIIAPEHVALNGPGGDWLLTPGTDPALRDAHAPPVPVLALIDPYRRERETESDQ